MRPPPSHDDLDEPTRLLPPALPAELGPGGSSAARAPLPESPSTTAAMPSGASDIRALVASRPDRTVTLRPTGMPRFELRAVLGRGGVGEVWLAFDRQLEREIALKFLQPSEGAVAPERLVREARIQAALDHPAIVPVYDVGQADDGRVFVAMKRVRGVTMASLLATSVHAGKRAGRTRLLRAFVRVCEAIEYAHASGIIHSDLKPENVLLGEFGDVYVLDWGISRRAGGRTVTAHFGGTPIYMAPERFVSTRPPDVASDVYALGCILFEILTGESLAPEHLPLPALAERVRRGLDARPESRALGRGCPRALSDACVAATAPDPAQRTRSVAELRATVEGLIDRVDEEAERRQRAESAAQEAEKLLARLVIDLPTIERAARLAGEARLLDPASPHAAAVLDAVLAAHTRVEGQELESILAPPRLAATRAHARAVLPAYAAFVAVAGIAFAAGLVDALTLLPALLLAAAQAGQAATFVARPEGVGVRLLAWMLGDALLVAWLTTLLGPLVVPPAVATMAAMLAVHMPAGRQRLLVASVHALGFGLPLVFECFAFRSLSVSDGTLHTRLLGPGPITTTSVLVVGTAFSVLTFATGVYVSLVLGRKGEALERAHLLREWILARALGSADGRPSRASERPRA